MGFFDFFMGGDKSESENIAADIPQIEKDRIANFERIKNDVYQYIFNTACYNIRTEYMKNNNFARISLAPHKEDEYLRGKFDILKKSKQPHLPLIKKACLDAVDSLQLNGNVSVSEEGSGQWYYFNIYINWS